jgi:hypothetical protein
LLCGFTSVSRLLSVVPFRVADEIGFLKGMLSAREGQAKQMFILVLATSVFG